MLYLSERANKLILKKNKTLVSISKIGGVHATTISKVVSMSIAPKFNIVAEAYVMDSLMTLLLGEESTIHKPKQIYSLQMGAPDFNVELM